MWQERRSGRQQQRSANDHRTPFERDNTRVIHAAAFRRLQNKTQIHGTGSGDFHRTRLTHSLEVASIAKSMVRNLRGRFSTIDVMPCEDLITTISLLHDIGHPPFGHGGETALNYLMRDAGGFESNAQTLRLLAKIEETYPPFGLDLTRRALLGILKYPVSYSQVNKPPKSSDYRQFIAPKCFYDCDQDIVDWVLAPLSDTDRERFQQCQKKQRSHNVARYHSLDCSIMNIADDIAYGVHDLEDAIFLSLLTQNDLDHKHFHNILEAITDRDMSISAASLLDNLFSSTLYKRKNAIGALVNFFITNTLIDIQHESFKEPLIKYHALLTPEASNLMALLKETIFKKVISSEKAKKIEQAGQETLIRLFDNEFQKSTHQDNYMRKICDSIASLSDISAKQQALVQC